MVRTVILAKNLRLTWTPGHKDFWLHAKGESTEGAICLEEFNSPLVRKAFMTWAEAIAESIDESR